MNAILLIVGLVGLWLGTELVVRGACRICRIHGIPEFIVGAAILSIGSDLPELMIAINGAVQDLSGKGLSSNLIVGSAVGSALGQFGLVLGLVGLCGYLALSRKFVMQHGAILLASVLLLGLTSSGGTIGRFEGALLLITYIAYLIFLIMTARGRSPSSSHGEGGSARLSWWWLITGFLVLGAASELTVRSATGLTLEFGIEQSLLALIVVGLGTSLPELSISAAAVLKKRGGLSIGNIIGSNIFDTLVPIGVAAVIVPLVVDSKFVAYDIPFLFLLSGLVLLFLYRKRGLQRTEALTILITYIAYVAVRVNL